MSGAADRGAEPAGVKVGLWQLAVHTWNTGRQVGLSGPKEAMP